MNIKVIFSGDEKASRLFIKTHLEKFTPVKKVYIGIFIAALVATIAFFIFDKNSCIILISYIIYLHLLTLFQTFSMSVHT